MSDRLSTGRHGVAVIEAEWRLMIHSPRHEDTTQEAHWNAVKGIIHDVGLVTSPRGRAEVRETVKQTTLGTQLRLSRHAQDWVTVLPRLGPALRVVYYKLTRHYAQLRLCSAHFGY
jgi:hypothetical protein